MPDDIFGETLRRMRKSAGKTMGDLARYLGVSITYISDVERGRRAPFTKDRILSIAQFLEADPHDLHVAAARNQGAFELATDGVSETAQEVGAALMRGWASLSDDDLEKIRNILRKGKKGR